MIRLFFRNLPETYTRIHSLLETGDRRISTTDFKNLKDIFVFYKVLFFLQLSAELLPCQSDRNDAAWENQEVPISTITIA